MHKVQKCLKWCNYAHVQQKSLKWAFIYAFSRMQVDK